MLVGGLGDLGLDVAILEHRLDDDVTALEIAVIFARENTAQDLFDAIRGRAALLEATIQCLADLLLAARRTREVAIEQYDIDPDLGGYVRDALPHQTRTDDPHLLDVESGNILWPARALLALLEAE
ncbi:MAG: hypothetical protein JRJ10_08995, partial [Deltaproteobacteria bacterium]|nr:hypothetical protein [Deltaproteobacteria bacterium]